MIAPTTWCREHQEKEILVSETINGSLSVSNDVIADIAGYAAMTCYGVVGMAEQLQGAESVRLLAGQRLRKGVLVSADENGLTVDLHVVLESGVNMKSVCHNLSSSVAFTLQEIAQIDPASLKIGIHIDALKSRLN
nr:Asp23/Gls24 family envelope stress response protein [Collinsella aerofaciens]